MREYLTKLETIMQAGQDVPNRTGVDTRALFGLQSIYDLRLGFPAMTTKKLAWKAVVAELLWFLEGSYDDNRLSEIQFGEKGRNTIWTANANADYWKDNALFPGDLGRVYGVQWRDWRSVDWAAGGGMDAKVDQITQLVDGIKNKPHDRRHIITAWNPGELSQIALPPCHLMVQFFVSPDGYLSSQMYQRSCDFFLGVPFNIASYALLTHIVAQVTGLKPGTFSHIYGDAHIYHNHFDQVREQLSREPHVPPELIIDADFTDLNVNTIKQLSVDNFILDGYTYEPPIKAKMAV